MFVKRPISSDQRASMEREHEKGFTRVYSSEMGALLCFQKWTRLKHFSKKKKQQQQQQQLKMQTNSDF